ncbi:guanylate kinase [Apostasia shenzhenica]|uniref:Guanylate kinase 1 n=1 Tax=Apostasia shenzhenica TaxID=1088818 RepID=A0A2I0ARR3_9ASPA|nr:guanylate kinase [Apostasia shenzhenica]
MGEEAPEYLLGKSEIFTIFGHDQQQQGYQTATAIGTKIYAVGGSGGASGFSTEVKVFDKLTDTWADPVVFGTKPVSSKGHSAILLENGRILILQRESSPDNSIWILEVDTPFVRQKKKLLGREVVTWSKCLLGNGPKPVVISGPSGVGKGTLILKLMKECPSAFGFSVSHTTRAPREKEENGIHYHFTERSRMEKDIRDGKFLEFALVHGNLYGTSIEAVEAVSDVGKRCILDIDVQGARSVRASSLEATFIFVCPPSFEELEKRLRARGTESEEQIQKRLRNAKTELEHGKSSGLFDHILVNDDLDSCYRKLKELLALDDNTNISPQSFMQNFILPISHSISKLGNKIMIQCGSNELGGSSPRMVVLDVSSLKGGAPSRTRGLSVYATES